MKSWFSNSAECHLDAIYSLLYLKGEKFSRKLIVADTNYAQSLLHQKVHAHGQCVWDCHVVPLEKALERIVSKDDQKLYHFPSHSELALKLSIELSNATSPLNKLFLDKELHPEKVYQVSLQLAHFYKNMLSESPKIYSEWMSKQGIYQETLKQVMAQFDHPQHVFSKRVVPSSSEYSSKLLLLILFPSSLPGLYQEWLLKNSDRLDVHIFFSSFSKLYWGDVFSEMKDSSTLFMPQVSCFKPQAPLYRNLLDLSEDVFEDYIFSESITSSTDLLAQDLCDLELHEGIASCKVVNNVHVKEACSVTDELHLLRKDLEKCIANKSTSVSDIVVLVSDMEQYYPFIQTIFSGEGTPLGCKIESLPSLFQSDYLIALRDIIALSSTRWTLEQVFDFADNPIVLAKLGIKKNDLESYRMTMGSLNIIEGVSTQGDSFECHTWDSGLRRLFDRVLHADEPLKLTKDTSISQLPSFMHFFSFILNLQERLHDLFNAARHSLQEWYHLILELVLDTLQVEGHSQNDHDRFFLHFRELATKVVGECTFVCLIPHLEKLLKHGRQNFVSTQGLPIRFTSFSRCQSYTAEHVFIIGCDDKAFLQNRSASSSLERSFPSTPIQSSDELMLAFGEVLFQRCESLSFYYSSVSFSGETRMLSPKIYQLMKHLERRAKFENMGSASERFVYAKQDVYQETKTKKATDLIQDTVSHQQPVSTFTSLSSLIKLMHHPIRYHCQYGRNVRFPYVSHPYQDQYSMHGYAYKNFLEVALVEGFDATMEKAREDGILPLKGFEDAQVLKLQKEYAAIVFFMQQFGISRPALKKLVISAHAQKNSALQVILPIGKQYVNFVGSLGLFCPKGLIIPDTVSKKSVASHWPVISAYTYYARVYQLPQTIFFTSSQTTRSTADLNPEHCMQWLSQYAEKAHAEVCWLFPELVSQFASHDLNAIHKSIASIFRNQIDDPYLKWAAKVYDQKSTSRFDIECKVASSIAAFCEGLK